LSIIESYRLAPGSHAQHGDLTADRVNPVKTRTTTRSTTSTKGQLQQQRHCQNWNKTFWTT